MGDTSLGGIGTEKAQTLEITEADSSSLGFPFVSLNFLCGSLSNPYPMSADTLSKADSESGWLRGLWEASTSSDIVEGSFRIFIPFAPFQSPSKPFFCRRAKSKIKEMACTSSWKA